MSEDTTLYLIRHGSTEINESGRMQGGQDVGLSVLGQKQADCIGRFLRRHPPRVLYTSPVRRASETAQHIATVCPAPIVTVPALVERSYGLFDGLTFAEVIQRRADLGVTSIDPTHDWEGVAGVEDDGAVWARVRAALQQMLTQHRGEPFGIVTHSGVIQAMLYHIFEIPTHRKLAFRIARGMFAELRYRHGLLELVAYYPDPCCLNAAVPE